MSGTYASIRTRNAHALLACFLVEALKNDSRSLHRNERSISDRNVPAFWNTPSKAIMDRGPKNGAARQRAGFFVAMEILL